MNKKIIPLILVLCFCTAVLSSQEVSVKDLKNLVSTYKDDARGPYHRIKWFCEDGTEREPRDPCPDNIDGIQHASFKESALKLRATNHLFFGEILAAIKYDDFLDLNNNFSRLKQYQINKYLASVDDGWILRKAQYYRGAIQSEDEQKWGKEFFERLLKEDNLLNSHYYIIRQALKDIPHNEDTNLAQTMRSQSKILSENLPAFMDIRIKIHGQPEATDLNLVKNFIDKNESKFSATVRKDFQDLIATMELYYKPLDIKGIEKEIDSIKEDNQVTKAFEEFLNTYSETTSGEFLVTEITNLLYNIRHHITDFKSSKNRLKILDLSNQLENTLRIEIQNWTTTTLAQHIHKINTLTCASLGNGLIEQWEYNAVEDNLNQFLLSDTVTIDELNELLNISRGVVEWNASMVKAQYQDVINIYANFEPLAYGFIDDRVRSSVALSLGEAVSKLGAFVAKESKINNDVMTIENQSAIRGLNPGYAYGELIVVDGNPDHVEVQTDKIYIFEKPPSDLKPVAGIMTVSEGNLVSHVQLLARNLGIPNAALSYENLKDLKKHNGKKVFYAVSNKGNVILKKEEDMSSLEKELFNVKQHSKNIITVPTDQIKLDVNRVVNMREVDAVDSGKLCGPKAANLGELKKMFPEQVVEGLIIPFGIFRNHMDQQMPNQGKSYWQYLNDTFAKAKQMQEANVSDEAIEKFQLEALDKLHKAIISIPLSEAFISDLHSSFKSAFGKSIGNVPVFLRSDTNMEDLKEFTGAGLNLTLFNILNEDKIVDGIKRVWASAYTERSFKWRQKYLSNPENVFPSILIIPSVDVDYSGVMITKGINSGNDNDLTVAFSRGAGGAVDGQSAETILITKQKTVLLAPARQPDYIRLPHEGGTKKHITTFENSILNDQNITDIRSLANDIRKTMSHNSDNTLQVHDVEFGFKDDKLWLFQIRPFVENKQAKSSEYLASISPKTDTTRRIKLSETL